MAAARRTFVLSLATVIILAGRVVASQKHVRTSAAPAGAETPGIAAPPSNAEQRGSAPFEVTSIGWRSAKLVGSTFRAQAGPIAQGSFRLLPGTFSGAFQNSLGHSGADELVITQVQGSNVRGAWSTFLFQGTLAERVLEFVVLNQFSNCRDYKVRLQFAPDGNSATSSYSVTDRCGPAYSGTQTFKRAGTHPSSTPALDLNGSWSSGLLHIWQDATQVLVTATWKRDGKYCIFRGEGQLNGRVLNLAIRYSPMTHGDRAEWRATFTVSEDGNTMQALYTLGARTERHTYVRDR